MVITTFLSVTVLSASRSPTVVPAQHIYGPDNVATVENSNGCNISRWTGMDVSGMNGYPWCTTISCDTTEEFEDFGVNLQGHIRLFLMSGSMVINNYTIDIIGGAYWIDAGTHAKVRRC